MPGQVKQKIRDAINWKDKHTPRRSVITSTSNNVAPSATSNTVALSARPPNELVTRAINKLLFNKSLT